MVAWGPIIAGGAALYSAFGPKKKAKKRSTLDKNQKKLWGEYHKGIMGEGPLADLYNFDADKARNNFEQNISRPAYQKYEENVVPQITGAFRSKGLGNSTYAGQALASSGRDVQNDLNAKLSDYMYNQEQSIYDRKANAINNSFQTQTFAYEKPQGGPFDSFMQGATGKFGEHAGNYLFSQLFPGG